jgi:hypothetical protein
MKWIFISGKDQEWSKQNGRKGLNSYASEKYGLSPRTAERVQALHLTLRLSTFAPEAVEFVCKPE